MNQYRGIAAYHLAPGEPMASVGYNTILKAGPNLEKPMKCLEWLEIEVHNLQSIRSTFFKQKLM